MSKFLIFTNGWDANQCGGFSLSQWLNQRNVFLGNALILLNKQGIVAEWENADIIILPDENIFFGTSYETSRNLLINMKEKSVTLFVVFHANGNFLRAYNDNNTLDNNGIKAYLRQQPAIMQSHVPNDFYCQELRKLLEAIDSDNSAYTQAIEDAKRKFPDPLLEAKLELLHRLLVPPSNLTELENNDGLWTKLINLVDESKKSEIERGWNTFKKEFKTEYSSEPFNGDYLKLLSALRDALLPEHEYSK